MPPSADRQTATGTDDASGLCAALALNLDQTRQSGATSGNTAVRDILATLGVTSDGDGLHSAPSDQSGKRVKGIEPSTFSLGSCAPEFESTATSTVTDDAAATMRNACPTPRPKATQSGHDSQFVAALSMLAELPLPDEVKVAALRKILRV